jgi:DNA-binding XRE family transcriptional regulator
MLVDVDFNNLPPFPKRIPEKLKMIREHLGLTPDEIAPKVGARTGAEILAYENDEDDLLVTVLWNYSKLAGCPIDNLIYDNLEVSFRDLRSVNNFLRTL